VVRSELIGFLIISRNVSAVTDNNRALHFFGAPARAMLPFDVIFLTRFFFTV
jgi:hypothetical protein